MRTLSDIEESTYAINYSVENYILLVLRLKFTHNKILDILAKNGFNKKDPEYIKQNNLYKQLKEKCKTMQEGLINEMDRNIKTYDDYVPF